MTEDKVPEDMKPDLHDLRKVKNYVKHCTSTEAFRNSPECFNFCNPSLTAYTDKTNSLHLFEKITPLLVNTLKKIFPVMVPEFLRIDLEKTSLVKLKKDIILDDGEFLYNMKSDYWIKDYSLEKVDKNLPFESSKFEHEQFFLVKFDSNESKTKIDTIEDNNHIKISSDKLGQEVTDENFDKRQEIAIADKIKNKMDDFIEQMHYNIGQWTWSESNSKEQYFFPVTKKGFDLNSSIIMKDNFDYSSFKIDPGFEIEMDLSKDAPKKFTYEYEKTPETVFIDFYLSPEQQDIFEIVNNHKTGKSFIMSSNQANILYLEHISIFGLKFLLSLFMLINLL
jgi:hypothetical protein